MSAAYAASTACYRGSLRSVPTAPAYPSTSSGTTAALSPACAVSWRVHEYFKIRNSKFGEYGVCSYICSACYMKIMHPLQMGDICAAAVCDGLRIALNRCLILLVRIK